MTPVWIWDLVFYRKRKDRHDGVAPTGFSRFPATEEDSDEDDEYEKERQKRSECFTLVGGKSLSLMLQSDWVDVIERSLSL